MKFLAFYTKNPDTDHTEILLEAGESISDATLTRLKEKLPTAKITQDGAAIHIETENTPCSGINVFRAAKALFGHDITREPRPRNRKSPCLIRIPEQS